MAILRFNVWLNGRLMENISIFYLQQQLVGLLVTQLSQIMADLHGSLCEYQSHLSTQAKTGQGGSRCSRDFVRHSGLLTSTLRETEKWIVVSFENECVIGQLII
jgi:hypothetical protein